jgi:hypothetical protein
VSERVRFVVTFTAAPGTNGVRSLRLLLKSAKRRFGLIAVDAREEPTPAPVTYAQVFTELRRSVAARRAARTSPHHEQ